MTAGPISRGRLIQFGEFMVGGGLYFVTGYIIFAACYSGLGWTWWQAKLAGDIVGWTLNYLVQRYWAFAAGELKKHEGRNRARYTVWTVCNLLLDYLIIGGLQLAGISPYAGMFIAAAFFTAWNYVGYRFWVFRSENQTAGKQGV